MKLTNKICAVGFLLVGICGNLVAADFYGGAIGQPGYSPFGTTSGSGGSATNVMSSLVVNANQLTTNGGVLSIVTSSKQTNNTFYGSMESVGTFTFDSIAQFNTGVNFQDPTLWNKILSLGNAGDLQSTTIGNGLSYDGTNLIATGSLQIRLLDFSQMSNRVSVAQRNFNGVDGSSYIVIGNNSNTWGFANQHLTNNLTTNGQAIYVINTNSSFPVRGIVASIRGTNDTGTFTPQYITIVSSNTLTTDGSLLNLGSPFFHILYQQAVGVTLQTSPDTVGNLVTLGIIPPAGGADFRFDNQDRDVRYFIDYEKGIFTAEFYGGRGSITNPLITSYWPQGTNTTYIAFELANGAGNGVKGQLQFGKLAQLNQAAASELQGITPTYAFDASFNRNFLGTYTFSGDVTHTGVLYIADRVLFGASQLDRTWLDMSNQTVRLLDFSPGGGLITLMGWDVNTAVLVPGYIKTMGSVANPFTDLFLSGYSLTNAITSLSNLVASGSQTPWLQVINGAGFALTNVGGITMAGQLNNGGFNATNINAAFLKAGLSVGGSGAALLGGNPRFGIVSSGSTDIFDIESPLDNKMLMVDLGGQFKFMTNIVVNTNIGGFIISNNAAAGVTSLQTSNSATSKIYQTTTGVGIGTATPNTALHVVGSMTNSGSIDAGGGSITSWSSGSPSVQAKSTGSAFAGLYAVNSVDQHAFAIEAGTGDCIIQMGGGAIPFRLTRTGKYLTSSNNVGIGTTSPTYGLHVAAGSGSWISTNAAPYTVNNPTASTLITNLNQRGTLVLKLAFDDVTGGIPSCTIVSTNLLSTNNFGILSPTLSGLTLVGTVTITNDYSYPLQTNCVLKVTDTSTGGAAIRVVQTLIFEQ